MSSMDKYLEEGEKWMLEAEEREDIARDALNKDIVRETTRLKAQAEFMEEYSIPTSYCPTPIDLYVEGDHHLSAWYRFLLQEFTAAARRVAKDIGWDRVRKVNSEERIGWKIPYTTVNGVEYTFLLTVPKELSCKKVPVTDENGKPVMEEKEIAELTYVTKAVPKFEIECKPLLAEWEK